MLSIGYSLSSGERKGRSLNHLNCVQLPSGKSAEGSRTICLSGVARTLCSLSGLSEVKIINNNFPSRSELESSAREGDSPVAQKELLLYDNIS